MRRRHKLRAALIVLAGIHGVILLAGFMAPYDFATQFRAHPFAPPAQLHFFDRRGVLHLRPFVYAQPGFSYSSSGTGIPIAFIQSIFLFPARPTSFPESSRRSAICSECPNRRRYSCSAPMNTAETSFPVFSTAGRFHCFPVCLGASFSVFFGLLIGAIAGFYGGWIDEALMRLAELFLACPWLYLLFAVRAALPLHLPEWQVFTLWSCVLGVVGWARPARLIRGVSAER